MADATYDSRDRRYMQTALRLAKRGVGSVEPNPAVGAVIVKADQIIGKGWHKKFGGPHAEINALEDCRKSGADPRGATVYVTLEPCSHQGKTGPCAQTIIEAGLAKVFVATADPSQHASGRGIKQLRGAGIEVQIGLCETEAKLLNAPFIKFANTGKCWVTLKWAQSIDGKLAWARQTNEHRWISNEQSRRDAHKLRQRAGGILVGINTVLADDPLLTARPSKGKKALRIVLDNHLRIPLDCKLLATAKRCPVLVLAGEESVQANPQVANQITKKGAELLAYPDMPDRSNLYFLLDELSKRGITHLLVEGGPRVLTSFLKENLADEIVVYIAPKILGSAGSADINAPVAELMQSVGLHHVQTKRLGDNVRLSGLTEKATSELLAGEV